MLYVYQQVWAEVLLEGSWVHVDPCEAAVNEPLIYESWGKRPTYVLAYRSSSCEHSIEPCTKLSSDHSSEHSSEHTCDLCSEHTSDHRTDKSEHSDCVCDVTHCYVSDAAAIADRRLAENITESEFDKLLSEANAKLRHD